MSQLLKQSTAVALDSENLPTRPSETALLDWGRYSQLADIPSEGYFPRWPNDFASVTAAGDSDVADQVFSNVTEDWKALQTPSGHYRVFPYGRKRTNWGIAEQASLSALTERAALVLIGSVPIVPEQDRLISERSTETDDSAFLIEEQLVDYLDRLVREAADQVFSDGMESAFSRRIILAVQTYGDIAVHAIARLISSGSVNVEVAGEILRQMGSMGDPLTHHSRMAILMNNLQAFDPRMRDAASLGLAALDDPAAIGALRRALERESSLRLQGNLKLVMDQLRSTLWQVS